MSLASLPDEVLKLVLHYVPINDRLGSCCLVNRRMHAAALAATQQVMLGSYSELLSHQREDCFRAWMPQYGQHLTCLELRRFPQPLQQLACLNLLHLQLWKCSVQLGPAADGHPGVIQRCTKLTHLELMCNIIDAPEDGVLDSLSSLVHLQHLKVVPWDVQHESTQPLEGVCSNTLPSLTKLTYLYFKNLSTFENLAQLGGLTNLQELYLDGADDDIPVGPITVPGMVLPASLTKLALRLPVETGILSLAPTELKDLQVAGYVAGPAEGPGSLLSYLCGLKHLVRLWLDPGDYWPPAGPEYSGITASSNLVSLSMSQNKLPSGIWPHVFPATRKLLLLTSLSFVDFPDDFAGLPATWTMNDLYRLVGCCPKLCKLDFCPLQHGCHVAYLSELTGLTCLEVMYADAGGDVLQDSMGWLATVTQLQDLSVTLEEQDVSIAAILPLTKLTGLTQLSCCLHDENHENEWLCDFTTKDSFKPDVWLQLVERCAADRDSQPMALRSLAQQLTEQGARDAEQSALVARQQQQLWGLEQVVAEQGARIAVLEGQLQTALAAREQQPLSDHQQGASELVAAEQGARIAVLEGQLQVLLQRFPPV